MVEVNEGSLQSAWQWVRDLNVAGSTNTLAALKFALGDPSTQAVYLLSDGRPDHVSYFCRKEETQSLRLDFSEKSLFYQEMGCPQRLKCNYVIAKFFF